jgi:hypothetical protein
MKKVFIAIVAGILSITATAQLDLVKYVNTYKEPIRNMPLQEGILILLLRCRLECIHGHPKQGRMEADGSISIKKIPSGAFNKLTNVVHGHETIACFH